MSDIFISYAKKDKSRVEPLAIALEKQGWTVWWDRKIPPGKTFVEVIKESIDEAKCVVVIWSDISIKSEWVQEEATIGKRRKILVPARIDTVEPPLGFGLIQAADLTGWKAETGHSGFTILVSAISEVAGPPPLKVKETEQKREDEDKEQREEAKRKADEERKLKEAAAERNAEIEQKRKEAEKKRKIPVKKAALDQPEAKAKGKSEEIEKPNEDRTPSKENVAQEFGAKPTAAAPPPTFRHAFQPLFAIHYVIGFFLSVWGLMGLFMGDVRNAKVISMGMIAVAASFFIAGYALARSKTWALAMTLIAVIGGIFYFVIVSMV